MKKFWTVVSYISAVCSIIAFVVEYGPKILGRAGAGVEFSAHPDIAGALTVAALSVSTLSIFAWTRRGKAKPDVRQWHSAGMERLVGKTFVNQVVELDGKIYEHCKFVNARLLFHGLGPCRFEECEFGDGVLVETDNVAAMGMLMLHNLALKIDPARGRVQLFGMDRHGKPAAIGPLLAPVPDGAGGLNAHASSPVDWSEPNSLLVARLDHPKLNLVTWKISALLIVQTLKEIPPETVITRWVAEYKLDGIVVARHTEETTNLVIQRSGETYVGNPQVQTQDSDFYIPGSNKDLRNIRLAVVLHLQIQADHPRLIHVKLETPAQICDTSI